MARSHTQEYQRFLNENRIYLKELKEIKNDAKSAMGSAKSTPSHSLLSVTDNILSEIKRHDSNPKEAKAFTLEACAEGTHPILHTKAKKLIESFIQDKKTNGTIEEKTIFAGMTKEKFIARLLTCRPLTFQTSSDEYLLKDGKT